MMKIFDYLILVLYVGLLMFLASCEKDLIVDDIIVEEETYSPIEYDEIHEFLSTPIENSKRTINVVVLNYIPSYDKGKTLTQTTFPFSGDNGQIDYNLSVDEYKKWVLGETIRVKKGIEEGSRFRGYDGESSDPYIGINVIKYINVYEMPKIPRDITPEQFAVDSTEAYYPDYNKLFDDIGMEDLVNNQDVKEIWFNRKSLMVPESNMSSPNSGDISNGYYGQGYVWDNNYEDNDLPIYDKTYVVYSHWLHNTYDFTLHVRGHQIERQFSALESNFFLWGRFKGFDIGPDGRHRGCGTVHYPVNATSDYQYDNRHYVMSDIEDWKPDGTGQQKPINSDSWKKDILINTNFPTSYYKRETDRSVIGNDPQGGWMIYWFKSIPGYQNDLEIEGRTLKNWWDTFYDWDYHYVNDKKLYN